MLLQIKVYDAHQTREIEPDCTFHSWGKKDPAEGACSSRGGHGGEQRQKF